MNEELDHVRRARLRSLILLLVVLLVGMLAGAAEERYLIQHATAHSASRHTYPGALGQMDLTASQRATIDSLIDVERPRIEAIVQPVIPGLRAKADSLRAVIRTVLTPEQQRAFDREPRPQGAELVRRFSKATAAPDTTP